MQPDKNIIEELVGNMINHDQLIYHETYNNTNIDNNLLRDFYDNLRREYQKTSIGLLDVLPKVETKEQYIDVLTSAMAHSQVCRHYRNIVYTFDKTKKEQIFDGVGHA